MTAQYDDAPPDDVPAIKAHLKVRREAMSAISAEMEILLYALRTKLGPAAFIGYLSEVAAEEAAAEQAKETSNGNGQSEQGRAGGPGHHRGGPGSGVPPGTQTGAGPLPPDPTYT